VRSVNHTGRAIGVALILSAGLAGCVTTQEKNARALLVNARTLAAESTVHVRHKNAAVSVVSVRYVEGAASGAIAVGLRSSSTHALSDLPISLGVVSRSGRRRYLNGQANSDYYDAHVPVIPVGATVAWVLPGVKPSVLHDCGTPRRGGAGEPGTCAGSDQPALDRRRVHADLGWRRRNLDARDHDHQLEREHQADGSPIHGLAAHGARGRQPEWRERQLRVERQRDRQPWRELDHARARQHRRRRQLRRVRERYVAGNPTISAGSPKNGATFEFGQKVTARYACAEATNGPGLVDCSATDAAGNTIASGSPLDTKAAGAGTLTITATSADGLLVTDTINYTVRPDNRFTVAHVKRHGNGSLSFEVAVPGPGKLTALEKAGGVTVASWSGHVPQKRTVRVTLKQTTTSAVAKPVLKLAFTPTRGKTRTETIHVP
jgi:hypothetical protein